MLSQYFKLREQPFGVTPDPKYLYASASHREALASLLYGLQSGLGFVSLIAKPGMGKTTLLFEVLSKLRDTKTTVFLFQAISTPTDLLRAILIDLGVKDVKDSLVDLQTQLNRILLSQCAARKPVVVVIDEAQNLSDAVLETVRMLSNFETSSQKLMQIILAGQPQLAEKLMAPDLLQLRQRISIFAHLAPLSMNETATYIHHRLKFAGFEAGEPIFTPAAVTLIARHCEGIPRNINNLCFNAMSLAFALKRSKIDSDIIDEVILDMNVRRHLQSAESYQPGSAECDSLTIFSDEKLAIVGENAGKSDVGSPAELPVHSISEPQTSEPRKHPLNEPLIFAVDDSPEMTYVPDMLSAPAPASVHDLPAGSAYAHPVTKMAAAYTPQVDDYLASTVIESGLATAASGRPAPPVRSNSSEQDIHDRRSQFNSSSLQTESKFGSAAPNQERASSDVIHFDQPILTGFERRTKWWRSGPTSWSRTAIVATVAGVALCAWLGLIDYRMMVPEKAMQASTKAAEPVLPSSDIESAAQSESEPSPAPPHKGLIRVKKVESLSTLCSSIYGECTPDLLEQLLAQNPSILYPNRLRPGQVISIPLDTHNSNTEK